jgi:catechol 2,3-dioxygenase-like lactoylglutathione lyase family enzyme
MVLRLRTTKIMRAICSPSVRKATVIAKLFGGLPIPGKAVTLHRDNNLREGAMAIFTHVAVGTNDLNKARQFYDAVLTPLGLKRLKDLGDAGSCWGKDREEFIVLRPADGKAATHANGGTISFEAPNRAAVAAFHKAALAAGGKDEGAVGPRGFWPNAYAGYARDLDGNKLACYCLKAE